MSDRVPRVEVVPHVIDRGLQLVFAFAHERAQHQLPPGAGLRPHQSQFAVHVHAPTAQTIPVPILPPHPAMCPPVPTRGKRKVTTRQQVTHVGMWKKRVTR